MMQGLITPIAYIYHTHTYLIKRSTMSVSNLNALPLLEVLWHPTVRIPACVYTERVWSGTVHAAGRNCTKYSLQ